MKHFTTDKDDRVISVDLADMYSNVAQDVAAKNKEKPGYVEVSLFNDEGIEDSLYDHACDLVQKLLKKGYHQSDIAFLVDTNREGEK